MAGPIEQDDPMVFLEPVGERKPHVLEIAAGAVQQHHRRIVLGGLRPLVDIDHMQPPATDLHERPAGGWACAILRAPTIEPAASAANSESRIPNPITVMRSNRNTMRRPG